MDMKLSDTKFEYAMLYGLFAACILVSGLILTAMVASKPLPAQWTATLTNTQSVSSLLAMAPSACTMPLSAMICLRNAG
jgi:hypothetical protein